MASMPPPPPGLEDVDRGPSQMAMWWSQFSIVFVLVVARFYLRGKTRAIGIDDWMIAVSLVLYAATCAMVTHVALIGGFRHMAFLTMDQALAAGKWNWASQAFGITLYSTSKASVALLLIRLLSSNARWQIRSLWFTMGVVFLWNGLQVILQFVQCDPPRALWTPGIPAKCWDPKVQLNIAISGISMNVFIDFYYALLPVTVIYNLQMPLRRKISICFILGLGIFAGITGIIKARYIVALTERQDLTWYSYDLYAWTAADIFLAHFCACIPPLRPVFERMGQATTGASSRMLSYLKLSTLASRGSRVDSEKMSSTSAVSLGKDATVVSTSQV